LVRIELDEDAEAPLETTGALRQVARRSFARRVLPIAIAAAAASAVTVVAMTWHANPDRPAPVTRFTFTLPEGEQFTAIGRRAIAIAPETGDTSAPQMPVVVNWADELNEQVIVGQLTGE
jgi:hypothetical protein